MRKEVLFVVVLLISQLWGCANQQSLTKQERETQNRADAAVAGILFENDLSEAASYDVHNNGYVVIKFAESVPMKKYTKVVRMLRSNQAIHGVFAEQQGREVCPLSALQ